MVGKLRTNQPGEMGLHAAGAVHCCRGLPCRGRDNFLRDDCSWDGEVCGCRASSMGRYWMCRSLRGAKHDACMSAAVFRCLSLTKRTKERGTNMYSTTTNCGVVFNMLYCAHVCFCDIYCRTRMDSLRPAEPRCEVPHVGCRDQIWSIVYQGKILRLLQHRHFDSRHIKILANETTITSPPICGILPWFHSSKGDALRRGATVH